MPRAIFGTRAIRSSALVYSLQSTLKLVQLLVLIRGTMPPLLAVSDILSRVPILQQLS